MLPRLPALIVAAVAYTVLGFVGFLLFVIPGIWVIVRCWLAFPLVIVNHRGGLRACEESVQLSKGNFFVIAALQICIVVTALLLAISSAALVGALAVYMPLGGDEMVLTTVLEILTAVTAALAWGWGVVVAYAALTNILTQPTKTSGLEL